MDHAFCFFPILFSDVEMEGKDENTKEKIFRLSSRRLQSPFSSSLNLGRGGIRTHEANGRAWAPFLRPASPALIRLCALLKMKKVFFSEINYFHFDETWSVNGRPWAPLLAMLGK